jgi:hypothetical protein
LIHDSRFTIAQEESREQKKYNKAKGGNYYEYYNSHHYHRSVGFIVRRGWRLLVEQTPVGA